MFAITRYLLEELLVVDQEDWVAGLGRSTVGPFEGDLCFPIIDRLISNYLIQVDTYPHPLSPYKTVLWYLGVSGRY